MGLAIQAICAGFRKVAIPGLGPPLIQTAPLSGIRSELEAIEGVGG